LVSITSVAEVGGPDQGETLPYFGPPGHWPLLDLTLLFLLGAKREKERLRQSTRKVNGAC